MTKYICRPYYGHDCNSESGFNNGHFLPEFEVDAADESEAACIAAEHYYTHEFTVSPDILERERAQVNDSEFGNGFIYYEFDHVWRVGDEEFTEEPEGDAEYTYAYKYIDFTNVELKGV